MDLTWDRPCGVAYYGISLSHYSIQRYRGSEVL